MRAVLFVFVCASITVYAKQVEQPHAAPFEPLVTLLLALNPYTPSVVTPKFTRSVDWKPMMQVKEIVDAYAEALYNAARNDERLDAVRSTLSNIRVAYDGQAGSDLSAFFGDVEIGKDSKKKLALDLLEKLSGKGSGPVEVLVQDTLETMIDNDRMQFLPSIIDTFEDVYRKELGVVICKLTSVVPFSEEQLSKLKETLREKGLVGSDATIWFATKLDKELLAGFIVEIDEGYTIDMSLRKDIQDYRDTIPVVEIPDMEKSRKEIEMKLQQNRDRMKEEHRMMTNKGKIEKIAALANEVETAATKQKGGITENDVAKNQLNTFGYDEEIIERMFEESPAPA